MFPRFWDFASAGLAEINGCVTTRCGIDLCSRFRFFHEEADLDVVGF